MPDSSPNRSGRRRDVGDAIEAVDDALESRRVAGGENDGVESRASPPANCTLGPATPATPGTTRMRPAFTMAMVPMSRIGMRPVVSMSRCGPTDGRVMPQRERSPTASLSTGVMRASRTRTGRCDMSTDGLLRRSPKQVARHDMHRPADHHRYIHALLGQVQRDLRARIAASHHERALADEWLRIVIVARMQNHAAERIESRHRRPIGHAIVAGGHHDEAWRVHPGRGVDGEAVTGARNTPNFDAKRGRDRALGCVAREIRYHVLCVTDTSACPRAMAFPAAPSTA